MKGSRCWYFHLLCLPFSFYFVLAVSASPDTHNLPANSLDSMIQSYSFKTLIRRRTGVFYNVPLPGNFSGVEAMVVKIRSRTLWLNGINISSFQIPPRTISIPPVRRVILVYQNLGNRSDYYYKVQNYTLATPVIGLLAYDGDGHGLGNKTLDLNIQRGPIIILFPRVDFPEGSNSTRAKCITFGSMGSQHLGVLKGKKACSTENGGHFAIVVPSEEVSVPPRIEKGAKAKRKRMVWVIALGIAAVGLIFLCFVALVIAKFVKKKRMEKMARRAEEGEVLETAWVRGSKMPSASMVRTQPVLENGSAP